MQLAALDHNAHTRHWQYQNKDGESVFLGSNPNIGCDNCNWEEEVWLHTEVDGRDKAALEKLTYTLKYVYFTTESCSPIMYSTNYWT